jgi:hypothetical protein
MLDVDYGVTIEVGYKTSTGFQQQNIRVPLLGDNSYQVVGINQAIVKWIKVKLTRSGAITSIKLCPEESVTPPLQEHSQQRVHCCRLHDLRLFVCHLHHLLRVDLLLQSLVQHPRLLPEIATL